MARHENSTAQCALCEQKLLEAHPEIAKWFGVIKAHFPDVHVSWTFRSKEWQDWAVQHGKSKAVWPTSAHNRTLCGKPYSEAMDLFRLDEHGVAQFKTDYYREIWEYLVCLSAPMIWGGKWKLGDMDHFQLDVSKFPSVGDSQTTA